MTTAPVLDLATLTLYAGGHDKPGSPPRDRWSARMTAQTPNLTPARRRGLAVLLAAERAGVLVRVSNTTTPTAAEHPILYWQTAAWLVAQGLAKAPFCPPMGLGLTDAGRRLAEVGEGRRLLVRRVPELCGWAIFDQRTGEKVDPGAPLGFWPTLKAARARLSALSAAERNARG